MNKIVITLVAAGTMFIAGCSSSATPVPTVTVTESVEVNPTPSNDDGTTINSNEDLYLLGIKSMNNPILNRATDAELLEMGYSVCDALNAGYSVDDVIQFMAEQIARDGGASDTFLEAVGYIIGAADTALCPGFAS
jgi:PBP1b-binding outer membrane lipoprotein LpoB